MRARTFILLVCALGLVSRAGAQNVFITEFVADNHDSIRFDCTSCSDSPKWIELYNAGPAAVNLQYWCLTSDPDDLTEWRFPATLLPPDSLMIVFASGPAGGNPLGYLQTNFELDKDGGFLALVKPGGQIAHQISYSGQFPDVAQGFPMSGTIVHTNRLLFLTPSPEARNPPPTDPSTAVMPLVLTELMYHPSPALLVPSPYDDQFEFIELKNAGSSPFNLGGVVIRGGISFDNNYFPPLILAPDQRVLVVKNRTAFESRYGGGFLIAGEFDGHLSDMGEKFLFMDGRGARTLFSVDYVDSWHPLTDGAGFSLVLVDEDAPTPDYGEATTWRTSSRLGGSPGQRDPPPPVFPPVLVNEILSRPGRPFEDVIEMFNSGTNDADITGWYLTDNFSHPKKFRIPEGTVIPAGGFLAFDEHAFNPFGESSLTDGFSFDALGEEVYLLSADAEGNLTGYAHGFKFGTAETNVTFGRHVLSTGEERFVPQSTMTFAAPNAGPKTGPVVISEIHYLPPGYPYPWGDAFIELHNITESPVPLYDTMFPSNRWVLGPPTLVPVRVNGIFNGFSNHVYNNPFPAGSIIPPGGRALVVAFDPNDTNSLAAFTVAHNVPPGTPVYGMDRYFLDNVFLANSPRSVELLRPDSPSDGVVPQILVDSVHYSNSVPWPQAANGLGPSLQRIDDRAYGDDPANWQAALPSPGAPNLAGTPPVILGQPADVQVMEEANVRLGIDAASPGPLGYQWLFGGARIYGATNGLLVLTNLQPTQQGAYSCYVWNSGGVVLSSNASVTLVRPTATDTARPTVTVTAPTALSTLLTNARPLYLTGTAQDETGVNGVFVQHDGGPFVSITGITRSTNGPASPIFWGKSVIPSPGTNMFRIIAVDWAANLSLTSAVSLVLIETNRPTLDITSPPASTTSVTSERFTLAGTAVDDVDVASVWVQRLGGEPVRATGTTHWSAAVPLSPGLNVVQAWAMDWIGNVSATRSVTILRLFANTFTNPLSLNLIISGNGAIRGATHGQVLKPGRRYTLRANPARGSIFSNWVDWATGAIFTQPALTLTTASNLVLIANFVPTPFLDLRGAYNGLFYSATNPAHLNAGYFTLNLSSGGGFTGRLSYHGKSHSLHGRFGAYLTAEQTINRPGTNDLHVTLRLIPGTDQISGLVSEDRFVSELSGHRAGFTDATVADICAGRYAAAFSFVMVPEAAPGTATVSISRPGRFLILGRLPDRTPVAKSVSAANWDPWPLCQVPLYLSLYRGHGSLFGWLKFTNPDGAHWGTEPLLWTKTPEARDPHYPAGFIHGLWLDGQRLPTASP